MHHISFASFLDSVHQLTAAAAANLSQLVQLWRIIYFQASDACFGLFKGRDKAKSESKCYFQSSSWACVISGGEES